MGSGGKASGQDGTLRMMSNAQARAARTGARTAAGGRNPWGVAGGFPGGSRGGWR
jgi:hypothetical protein